MGTTTPPHLRARLYENDDRIGILYLAPWVDLGGSDKGTIDWFRCIDRTRFRPYLITTQPSQNRWLHLVAPFAEEIWELPDLFPGGAFPEFILGFIASRGIEVVHIMNSRLAFDMLVDFSMLPEPPVIVVQFHAEEPDRSGYVRYVSTRYGNLVSAFSVTSHQLARAMGDYDIPASQIAVITTGVDAAGEFDPSGVEPLPDVDRDRPAILWPGRLTEQKDPLLTLDVVDRLSRRDVDFLVHIVGDGHMEGELRDRARELGIESHLRWYPPAQGMARWYASSDVLLMTSVFEGVPYVIYEAFAMGVPVVAPALAGNLEIVDEDSGWLIDPRDDAEAYVDALQEAISDLGALGARGERARARMVSEHTLGRMAQEHEALYERLLAARRQQRQTALEAFVEAAEPAEDVEQPAAPRQDPIRLERDPVPSPTVAVVIPCYRHGRFLHNALASVRRQTLPAAQVLVVDDASDDQETIDVLAMLDDEDWVEVIHLERNSGPSVARNRALERVTANYYLPLDADDELYDTALERMLAELEVTGPDIGFVYPNPEHFGNRHDYVEVPTYNLSLLLKENYCPATALFDRRIFDAGVRYPEEVAVGHEDWELVLRIAARGVWGIPATGKTFRYRKRGFSRVDVVTHSGELDKAVRARHPILYDNEDRIKAQWAPALSIVPLDVDGSLDVETLVQGLVRQTCLDFEVVDTAGLRPMTEEIRDLAVREQPLSGVHLPAAAAAIRAARGRCVMLLESGAEALFADPAMVEKLLRTIMDDSFAAPIAIAPAVGLAALPFRQLAEGDVADAEPCAVLWSRDPARTSTLPVTLGRGTSVVEDIVFGLALRGPVQWRAAGRGGEVTR